MLLGPHPECWRTCATLSRRLYKFPRLASRAMHSMMMENKSPQLLPTKIRSDLTLCYRLKIRR